MLKVISTIRRIADAGLPGLAVIFMASGSVALADEPNPYAMENNSWITISGTVANVDRDHFTLDYGRGSVTVEMDDGDRDADAYKLLAGDKVTVSGRVDDDLYEVTKIEASSVYVENLGTTFFASAVDEEDMEGWAVAVTGLPGSSTTVIYGTVTDVDSNEFTVNAGIRGLRVDVDEMPYNPLDDEGYQKIEVGDRVKVTGEIDENFFAGRELEAESVIKLNM